MKRIILIAALALGVAFAAAAQPRAIGVRLGYGGEISYQHTLGGANFVEANLGSLGFVGLDISATYNFMIAQPNWTDRGEWGFYAGPGVALGLFHGTSIAIQGQVGIEYTFWFPLQLAIDLKPQIGIEMWNGGVGFYQDGLLGFAPALSVRYRF